MRRTGGIKAFLAVCLVSSSAMAQAQRVVAHWRFDGGAPGETLSADSVLNDLSGNQNHLRAFGPATAGQYSADVWPLRKGDRRTTLNNALAPARNQPTRDLYTSPHHGATFDLTQDELPLFTVEAIVRIDASTANWEKRFQTIVGRDGYNLNHAPADRENPLANLALKKRGDRNTFSIEAFDASGNLVVVESKSPAQPGVWYALAAVSDGKTLSLYLKEGDQGEYELHGQAVFHGALLNGRRIWTVGRGAYMNHPAEQFFGLIDEVRVSASAVSTDDFLGRPGGVVPKQTPLTVQRKPTQPWPARSPSLVGAHDPTVILDDNNRFHMFSSHGNLMHWSSDDLVKWTKHPSVLPGVPQWATQQIGPRAGLWAPEVLHFNGRYHLYYSTSTFGSQRSAIGLASTRSLDPQSPDYGWTDQGKVFESHPGDPYNAIDAAPLMDHQGQPWMAFGSWNRGLFLLKLDKQTGKQSATDTKLYHLYNRPGKDALEAPALFYHDGWYYLLGSWDHCCRGAGSTYKVMMGRSKSITGPYMDMLDRPLLDGHGSLLLRSHDFYAGPGQGNLITRAGETYFIHHYYDLRDNGVPTVSARPVYWDQKGWPIVGEDLAEESSQTRSESLAGRYTVQFDYGRTEDAELTEDGKLLLGTRQGLWEVTQDPRQLQKIVTLSLPQAGTIRCFVSHTRNSFVGRSDSGEVVRAVRSR